MLSEKGQESAPFELLIAIIVMTFVIVVGFNALETLNRETCEGKINKNLEDIKTAIESVVKNKSKTNVSYELPNCYSENESGLIIVERNDTVYCSNVCGGSLAQCTVLQFSSDDPSYTETKCLRISSATTFPDEYVTCPTDLLEPAEGYTAVDWKAIGDNLGFRTSIIPGQYTLIRQSNLFSQAPIICVYRRE
ncbi:MAG: hypothetical protein CL944_00555 [Candidatus Diapherotrites archaeon]|uniref:Class III signal peptide-containing protein n=1 Tax=Candidatus Iainarchaeum sp. TaxID=3101447 RepID=A0A2D6LP44_9ARCH|nr:hypothetical protein [Candidatus Diapherotrites archaeon]